MNKHNYLLVLISLISIGKAMAQCLSIPAEPACSGTLATNNVNILAGTYYFNGGTLTGVNLNGGTLILCSGTTSLSANLNSGSLIIKTGATINTGISTIPTGFSFYNYGTANFTSGLLENSSGSFMNSPGSHLNITGNFNSNGSVVTNGGVIAVSGTLGDWQNSGGICQDAQAILNTGNISFSSLDNWFSCPSGACCISYTGTAIANNNHPFASSSNVNVCAKPGASAISGTGSWGSASLTTDCASCSVPLPVELLHFNVLCEGDKVKFSWSTASEINNNYFTIEQSRDSKNWEEVAIVSGAGNSNTIINYESFAENTSGRYAYYRLKQTDFDGQYAYSKIQGVANCYNAADGFIKVSGNNFTVNKLNNDLMSAELYDVRGRLLQTYDFRELPVGVNTFSIDDDFAQALYLLRLKYEVEKVVE
ncbi:MAG: hypothetical protein ACKOXB_09315 [Flavobacteriales bacterium]